MTRIEQAQEIADRVAKPTPMAMKACAKAITLREKSHPRIIATLEQHFAPALDWNRRARKAMRELVDGCTPFNDGDFDTLRALLAEEQST